MTLLSIAVAAAGELSIQVPTVVFSATTPAERQFLAISNRVGVTLMGEHDWPILQRESILTLAGSTAEYALPSDYDRIIRRTSWDRSDHWELLGPMSPQEWQWRKSGIVATSPRRRYRLKPASASPYPLRYVIDPTPAAGDAGSILVFEYISNGWCRNAAGDTFRSAWGADDDTGVLDEDLLTLGLIWRYKRSKGMAYDDEEAEYDAAVDAAYAQQLGTTSLSLTRREASMVNYVPSFTVPEADFGL